jgi:hypothetical protein
MVEIETWLQGREVEIAPRVAADGVVSTTMHGHADAGSLWPPTITLHEGLEEGNVFAVEDRLSGVAECRPAVANIVV